MQTPESLEESPGSKPRLFARLCRVFPRTGGPYAYARRAFGDFIVFQTAWGYGIAAWAGNAALAFLYSAWAIAGSGKDIIAKGFVLLLGGIPVYVLVKPWAKRHPAWEAAEAPAAVAGGARRRRLTPPRRMGVQH